MHATVRPGRPRKNGTRPYILDYTPTGGTHRQAFIEILKRTETIISDLRNKIENQADLAPPNKPKEVVNDDAPLAIPPAFRRGRVT